MKAEGGGRIPRCAPSRCCPELHFRDAAVWCCAMLRPDPACAARWRRTATLGGEGTSRKTHVSARLPSFAVSTRCPVLTYVMLLPGRPERDSEWYAYSTLLNNQISVGNIAYGAVRCPVLIYGYGANSCLVPTYAYGAVSCPVLN